jgi:O-antigen/teichoic acid export membrane protein
MVQHGGPDHERARLSLLYWKNIVKVSGGVIFGQMLGIVGYLFLTWVYGPAEFGSYASWLALVAFGSVLSTGALETSLVQDDDGAPRRNAVIMILLTTLLGSVAYALLCAFVVFDHLDIHLGSRLFFAMTILLSVFALAANNVLQSWSAAEGRFRALTILRIVQSASIVFLPLLLSLVGRTSVELILGHAAGLVVSTLAWLAVLRPDKISLLRFADLPAFWRQRQRCFKFVLPALIVGACVANLPQLAINARFGSTAAGYMALAQRVLGTPLSLVGVAVRDVFKRFASLAFRERGECSTEFRNSALVLGAVAIGFAAIMFLFAEDLFVLVFGEKWRVAGSYAILLLPMSAIGIVASPLTYLVYIVRREEFDLYWQTALLAIVAAAWFSFSSVEMTLRVYALAYAAMYGVYLLACHKFAKGKGGAVAGGAIE